MLSEGQFLGDQELLMKTKRTQTATCISSSCTILFVRREVKKNKIMTITINKYIEKAFLILFYFIYTIQFFLIYFLKITSSEIREDPKRFAQIEGILSEKARNERELA